MIKYILNLHKQTYHLNWIKHLILGGMSYSFFLYFFNYIESYYLNAIVVGLGWELFWLFKKGKAIDGMDIFWTQLVGMIIMTVALILGHI